MISLIVLAVGFIFLPESLLACPKHNLPLSSAHLKPATDILVNMLGMIIISTPLGLFAGRAIRRLSPASRKLVMVLAIAGLFAASPYKVSACHGVEAVGPILEKVYAAQMEYYKQHGVYAGSFDELGFAPAANQYSFFLPSQTLLARQLSPKEGVDLGRLPEGVAPAASAELFAVVAIGFAEPNRIDIWTMDQKKDFREWSVPAIPKVKAQPLTEEPRSVTGRISNVVNQLEKPLMTMAIFLGLSLGLMLSLRAGPRLTPAGL